MSYDTTEGVRLRMLQLQPSHNTAFGEYVQSHAFNLALSKRMIDCLVHMYDGQEVAIKDHRWYGEVYTSQSLIRRGLVVHHKEWHDGLRANAGGNVAGLLDGYPLKQLWEVTTAGKLVVQLLVEAGLVSPSRQRSLPPPPPDWVDPRPKLRI